MNKKFKFIILSILLLTTCGCGASNYITDDKNKIVQYEETGQNLPNNILCKPEKNSELYNVYLEHNDDLKISMDKLPYCSNFKITSNKSSGLWEFLFIKPLAWLLLKLGNLVGNMGISLIIVGLLIRVILLPFSFKTQKQSKNMAKMQGEMQKLEYKYRGRDDQESQALKAQEMMALYKKNGVNPIGGCLIAFLQLPIFFAFLQAINRVPAIFEDTLLGFKLGMTPYVGISNGNYWYILLIILIAASTYFSFKYSMKSNGAMSNNDQAKQMSTMTNVMVIMIVLTSFSLTTALSFYWIVTYAFIALQTFIFKKMLNKNEGNNKNKTKSNKIKEKLEMKKGLKYGNNN